jgi:hypothetical protein
MGCGVSSKTSPEAPSHGEGARQPRRKAGAGRLAAIKLVVR